MLEVVQPTNINDHSSDFLQSVFEPDLSMLQLQEETNCNIQDQNVIETENVTLDFELREEKKRRTC